MRRPCRYRDPVAITDDDPRIELGYQRLRRYWDRIGPSDGDVISYLINPMFMGKPAWPNTRQAFRVVRPPRSLILASDGLGDPFVGTDRAEQGLGCEVYLEAPAFTGASFDALRDSWAFALVENFAANVADWGGISGPLAQYGVLSTEIPMDGVLPDDALLDGSAGLLVGLPVWGRSRRIEDMPFGPLDVVCVTLLRPEELTRIRRDGRAGRDEVVAARRARLDGHLSRLP